MTNLNSFVYILYTCSFDFELFIHPRVLHFVLKFNYGFHQLIETFM